VIIAIVSLQNLPTRYNRLIEDFSDNLLYKLNMHMHVGLGTLVG